MRPVWFACCSCAEFGIVHNEVRTRDPAAQILRIQALSTVASVMSSFPGQCAGIVIYACSGSDGELERGIAELCAIDSHLRIIIALDRLDPAYIARLFHAGASEVIAAGGGTHSTESDNKAYTEERADKSEVCPPERDDGRSGGPAEATSCDPKRLRAAGPARAPWDIDPDGLDRDVPFEETDLLPDEADCDFEKLAARSRAAKVYGAFAGRAEEPKDPGETAGTTRVLGECNRFESASSPGEQRPSQPSGKLTAAALEQNPSAARAGSVDARVSSEKSHAPLIAAISGRGGCGKTTIVASMACCAAQLGLRCAVIDLDLMFGNLYDLMGLDSASDLAALIPCAATGALREEDIVRTSMRVCPGLSLWGPLAAPEQAELMHQPVEMLLETLRRESDVVLIDTSTFWGDAVAGAVALSDRCLVVGDQATSSPVSVKRVISLANSIGVPRTRMTCVINRFGSQMCKEDHAMRLEMAAALSSKARILDGGADVPGMLSFGRVRELMEHSGAYADSVRSFTLRTLAELGCRVDQWAAQPTPECTRRGLGLRLPWARQKRNRS
ncbi:hypothetical protein Corgl_0338 [Coriobacterium glomerans PW2]|uniref:CobQ/CobB/MinD/ParA nucleotide binding domain-containing protein n=1 Tax=Coriobacterium glomerans (strain ATCC 49209 / DSM 20642 / JCM 10262 / PW2) TaxID=700015 RepID=F2NA63_CORGP|nr:AAA family ATPase [Coriobacterium glomerans]AEB06457.1 hypothetical protein Corgl_0338 [Coriobacterium glomerans PW2]